LKFFGVLGGPEKPGSPKRPKIVPYVKIHLFDIFRCQGLKLSYIIVKNYESIHWGCMLTFSSGLLCQKPIFLDYPFKMVKIDILTIFGRPGLSRPPRTLKTVTNHS